MKSIHILLLFMALIAVSKQESCYIAYVHANFNARSFKGCAHSNCVTLTKHWKIFFKSINTQGNCVKLFSERGCGGSSIEVKPGSSSHNDLRAIGWSKTASIREC